MKKIFFLLSAAFIFSVKNIKAQTAEKIPCPSIVLKGPAGNTVEEGDSLVLKVNPLGKAYDNIGVTYNWAISSGFIEQGQGTARIKINTEGLKGQTVTASVELGGLEAACNNISSYAAEVIEKHPKPKAPAKPAAKPKAKGSSKRI
ncbi:MAG: hypothetical protein JNM14_12740 [Ferruginibacter sp.]|nr:hypothetical protein [Ferruginibacter sp.]